MLPLSSWKKWQKFSLKWVISFFKLKKLTQFDASLSSWFLLWWNNCKQRNLIDPANRYFRLSLPSGTSIISPERARWLSSKELSWRCHFAKLTFGLFSLLLFLSQVIWEDFFQTHQLKPERRRFITCFYHPRLHFIQLKVPYALLPFSLNESRVRIQILKRFEGQNCAYLTGQFLKRLVGPRDP